MEKENNPWSEEHIIKDLLDWISEGMLRVNVLRKNYEQKTKRMDELLERASKCEHFGSVVPIEKGNREVYYDRVGFKYCPICGMQFCDD